MLGGPGLHYLGLIVVPKQAEGCACLQLPAVALQPGFQENGLHDGSCAQGEWWFLEQLVCIHSPGVVSVLWPSLPSPCKPSSQEPQLSIARMGARSSKRTQQLCGGYNLVSSCCTLSTGQSTQKGTPWNPGTRSILLWERREVGRKKGGSSGLTRNGLSRFVLFRAEEPAGTDREGERGQHS